MDTLFLSLFEFTVNLLGLPHKPRTPMAAYKKAWRESGEGAAANGPELLETYMKEAGVSGVYSDLSGSDAELLRAFWMRRLTPKAAARQLRELRRRGPVGS